MAVEVVVDVVVDVVVEVVVVVEPVVDGGGAYCGGSRFGGVGGTVSNALVLEAKERFAMVWYYARIKT